ncbi:hypothetical protein ACFXOD_33075 [Streptomyces sp. NPDC059161]|uniref:hypothetical protein n=1 Tax=Streptomyces sp. NPDC059161 TaxID=3346749 RepID=UPI0036A3EC3F
MNVAAPQPGRLPAPQAHPPEQQHDQAVPRAAARAEHRHELRAGRTVDLGGQLPQPVHGTQPIEQAAFFTRRLHREIPAVGELVDLPQHPARRLARGHRVRQQSPTATSTRLIRRSHRTGAAPGPGRTTTAIPSRGAGVYFSQTMNRPRSRPASGHDLPVAPHQRR